MLQIYSGSLEIIEVFNGYVLYGDAVDNKNQFIAHIGDGVDTFMTHEDYDPNDDPLLEEAYGFELV
jgi:hypothetical protein